MGGKVSNLSSETQSQRDIRPTSEKLQNTQDSKFDEEREMWEAVKQDLQNQIDNLTKLADDRQASLAAQQIEWDRADHAKQATFDKEYQRWLAVQQDLLDQIQNLKKIADEQNATIAAKVIERDAVDGAKQAELEELIQASVDKFLKTTDEKFTETIYRQFTNITSCEGAPAHGVELGQAQLSQALAALGIRLSEEEIDISFKAADLDSSKGLSLNEFRQMIATPTKMHEYVSTVPLAALLGSCLSFKGGNDPLQEIASLTDAECQAVAKIFSVAVCQFLEKKTKEAKEILSVKESAGSGSSAKFQAPFKMSAGNIDNFHAGLSERVGAPHPELEKGMEQEHCEKAGCDDEFETSNYAVRTTPHKEYKITVKGEPCPREQMKDKQGRVVRVIRSITMLREEAMVKKAGLQDIEIVAVVLYTGPMFQVYNTILRRYPEHVFKTFEAGNNLYATTIHILVSATMKISQTQRVPSGLKLYSGLGGLMELPEGFYRADERGCRGCMEWGFLSTTSDKQAALEYCGVKEGRPAPMVLGLTTTSVDRPACIYDVSQYPGEREYLFVPCSFLEPLLGAARVVELVKSNEGALLGAVEVVPVRINANLKGVTVDQLQARKKALHLDAFRYAIDEAQRHINAQREAINARIERDPFKVLEQERFIRAGGKLESLLPSMYDGTVIRFTGDGLEAYVMREARAVLMRHGTLPNEVYTRPTAYRRLADESLRTVQACSDVLNWYLEDATVQVSMFMRIGIADGQWRYTSHLWRQVLGTGEGTLERRMAARRMCEGLGLMEGSEEEADAEGLTPLMRAAAEGAAPRALRCLVWAGAQVDRRQETSLKSALFLAAQFGHAHAVEELSRLGADLNLTANPGFESTAAGIAAQEGHVEVIEVLGRLGADLNRPRLDGCTPVYTAARMGRVEVVRALHSFKADVNATDCDGWTPMYASAEAGRADSVVLLHSLKADLNTPSKRGTTPLAIALRKGHDKVVETLRGLGAC